MKPLTVAGLVMTLGWVLVPGLALGQTGQLKRHVNFQRNADGGNSPAEIEQAKKRGEAKAAMAIQAGHAVILYFGKPWSQGKPLVDEATKLPVKVMAGCIVTPAFVAEVTAHNDAIRDWHAKNAKKD